MLHEFIVTHRDEIITRTGHTAHEARDFLSTAFLAFHALKRGDVAINGSTGAMLGRSLMALRDLIDRTLSEVRLVANVRGCTFAICVPLAATTASV